jgi:hypothetical protein
MAPELALSHEERLRWKWWDRFWLRCGFSVAAVVLLLDASRLLFAPAHLTAAGIPNSCASEPLKGGPTPPTPLLQN